MSKIIKKNQLISSYRKCLLISACFLNVCTTYISEVHASEKHGLISKWLRYFILLDQSFKFESFKDVMTFFIWNISYYFRIWEPEAVKSSEGFDKKGDNSRVSLFLNVFFKQYPSLFICNTYRKPSSNFPEILIETYETPFCGSI